MNPSEYFRNKGVPRIRGDDPKALLDNVQAQVCSPHTRG